ncbi:MULTISPECIES: type II toxin-antitoxin system PemK/MazF family toxin [Tetragenococcus]|uniref:Uncharacterized protein n=4 Tax=Tetragenococcus TaxID=51668 RepID=A0A2H6CPR8_TETHA|nr:MULTISPECIES: type II toxin-antitoxin system PemK/MazF family toxin [Tetragenococcus]GMA52890.1 mRNA interferase PemK [Alicyclobacillus contaminans]AOF48313.1 PemK family transcriptional regulator [Tetragenococcus halophilus]AYW47342.1 type II toxin-antitoxin system PemK/MazF family toxin [Tetragenococcus osmophilus]AYW49752.1 type II toxin-antitoxin system PemK/MazF family toxin [Tetragenococcus halophilus]MCF1602716.1 type II toxin-antitoxin system PemK/MazF family toxin [Tetragenococcus 
MTNHYTPEKGDIVWIDFDPSTGMEIQKRRPALVISRGNFNTATKFAVVCPITSTEIDLPTRYSLSENYKTKGQIVIHQMKSLDFNKRKIDFIEKMNPVDLKKIEQIIEFII